MRPALVRREESSHTRRVLHCRLRLLNHAQAVDSRELARDARAHRSASALGEGAQWACERGALRSEAHRAIRREVLAIAAGQELRDAAEGEVESSGRVLRAGAQAQRVILRERAAAGKAAGRDA